jgi:hypothetical protein
MILLWLIAGFAIPVTAARFHVLPGGQRSSGPSTPGDWSPENCYPTLISGSQAAAPGDTLLLSLDDHFLDSIVTLPAMLAGRHLGHDADHYRVIIADGGGLQVPSSATGTTVRGVSLVTGDPPTGLPALRILAPDQSESTVHVESCVFSGLTGSLSSSIGGSAIHIEGGEHRLAMTVHGSRFLDCSGTGRGGAVYGGDGVDLWLSGCVLERNESRNIGSTAFGGAIAVVAGAQGSSLTLEGCFVVDSVSWGPGGAVYVQDGSLTMLDTEVRGSRSAFSGISNWSAGAGVFVRRIGSSPLPVLVTAERCRFIDNKGDLTQGAFAGDGGGMMLRGSDSGSMIEAVITDCIFEDNFNDQGAGLYVGRGVTATIERSLFMNNTALRSGGGSYKGGQLAVNMGETALFIYCVFAGNRAGWDQHGQPYADEGFGGAFMTRRSPRAEFHNCTFADNLSGPITNLGDAIYNWSEGGFWDDLQRSRLVNCLFYGTEGNDVQVRSDPTGFTEVLNCAWEPGQFVASGVTPEGTVLLSGSPFDPQGGWRLTPDSSCIDAGVFLGHDMDFSGAPVPSGSAPDVGALEYQFPVGVTDIAAGDGPVRALGLLSAWPNPANPRTELAFTLVRAAFARLTVHDLSGRLICKVSEGFLPAGDHGATWDGRTLGGTPASSGVYLVRLSAGGAIATQKIMLVR